VTAVRPIRAFVIDDEPLALKRLARMIETTGRVEITGRATDPERGLKQVAAPDADVLFLDIHMQLRVEASPRSDADGLPPVVMMPAPGVSPRRGDHHGRRRHDRRPRPVSVWTGRDDQAPGYNRGHGGKEQRDQNRFAELAHESSLHG
jgi:DNA-binding NarL/FixJ family response regulator